MKIRDINLGDKPVLLAPMEDVTDQAFRLLCKEFGASMVYSEFVSADALIRNVNRSLEKIRVDDRERPVAIQIYGRDVESMVEAAKIAQVQSGDAAEDICDNMIAAMQELQITGLTGAMTWSANGEVDKVPTAMIIKDGVYVGLDN